MKSAGKRKRERLRDGKDEGLRSTNLKANTRGIKWTPECVDRMPPTVCVCVRSETGDNGFSTLSTALSVTIATCASLRQDETKREREKEHAIYNGFVS